MNQQLISPTKCKNRKSVHVKSGKPTAKRLPLGAQVLIRKVETATKNTSRQSSKPKPVEVYLPKQHRSAHRHRKQSHSPNRGKEPHAKILKSSKGKVSFEGKGSRKLQRSLLRQKKMEMYLKSKADMAKRKVAGVQSYFQSTRSYHPLSLQREEIMDRQSFTVSQGNFQDESLCRSQYQEGPDTPLMTQLYPKVEAVYQQGIIISQLPENNQFSKSQWEAFESLRLKNEELSNYIEQLERVEQRMGKQSKEREESMRSQYTAEKDQMMKEIGKLKEDQNKLCKLNASLLQMVNESKQNLDAMKVRCSELNKSVELAKSRELILQKQKISAVQKAIQLQRQLLTHQTKMDELEQQKRHWQQKICSCSAQKSKIKTNAQEMLKMLQLQLSQDL